MKIGYLIAAFVFLANPNIGIVDFLPDFIGYLLIVHALSVSSVLIPYWKDAVRGAEKLLVISAVKLVCVPLLYKDISSLPILLSFSFAVLELIFLIPTVGKLFEGLFYVGMRYDIPSVFSNTAGMTSHGGQGSENNKKERGPKVRRSTVVFVIFRSAVSVIPNVSDLQLFDNSEKLAQTYTVRLSDFNSLFALSAFVVGLVGGIIWLARIIPYFSGISGDDAWPNTFGKVCEELRSDHSFADRFATRRIFTLIMIAVCTSVFILIDGINYLIGVIPALVIAAAAVLYAKYDRKAYFLIIPAAVCSISSVLEFSSRRAFFSEFDYETEAALWIPNAGRIYSRLSIYTCITRIFLLISLIGSFVLIFCKWSRDFNSSLNAGSADTFNGNDHTSLGRRYKVLAAITIPLFAVTAFEPWIVLRVDFITSLMTIISVLWAFAAIIILSDMMKECYSIEIDIFPQILEKKTDPRKE